MNFAAEIDRLTWRLVILEQALRLPDLALDSAGRAFSAWCDAYETRDALVQAEKREKGKKRYVWVSIIVADPQRGSP